MLNKRTQILLSEEQWRLLNSLAKERGSSIAELVREAVLKAYSKADDLRKSQEVVEAILAHRRQHRGITDYTELINYDRKY